MIAIKLTSRYLPLFHSVIALPSLKVILLLMFDFANFSNHSMNDLSSQRVHDQTGHSGIFTLHFDLCLAVFSSLSLPGSISKNPFWVGSFYAHWSLEFCAKKFVNRERRIVIDGMPSMIDRILNSEISVSYLIGFRLVSRIFQKMYYFSCENQ